MFKFSNLVGISAVVLLAACMQETEMAEAPMASGTVVDSLIGKSLVAENATFIFNSNGTMGGQLRGEAVSGTYVATDAEVCSTYTAPEALTGREFCSVPAIGDGSVVFNRRDGSQSPAYAIES